MGFGAPRSDLYRHVCAETHEGVAARLLFLHRGENTQKAGEQSPVWADFGLLWESKAPRRPPASATLSLHASEMELRGPEQNLNRSRDVTLDALG